MNTEMPLDSESPDVNAAALPAASSRKLAYTWPYARRSGYEDDLRRAAGAWFHKQGAAVHPRMPYLLHDFADWPRNIILPEVAEFIRTEQASRQGIDAFPLHKYLHHGLSSQAMLFNLIGPLITRNDVAPLAQAFRAAGVPWPNEPVTLKLEEGDRTVFNEDMGQPTSLDLAIYGAAGDEPLFVEAKLSENGFGGCSVFAAGDCDGHNPAQRLESCYLHHIGRQYWQRMVEHGVLDSQLARDTLCPFTIYYQFFRESLFAAHKGGHFVLLYDARSPVFVRRGGDGAPKMGLWPLLAGLAPKPLRARLHAVTIQQVVAALHGSARHADWVGLFGEKYGIGA